MQQHPVPQPITSYEFRLVGDMTIKQFSKVATGVILALIVYGINPPIVFIKWFFIVLFAGTGFAVAFVPFNGRPIDVWLMAFFKRIYSPTQYLWKQAQPGESLASQTPLEKMLATFSSISSLPQKLTGLLGKKKGAKTIAPAISKPIDTSSVTTSPVKIQTAPVNPTPVLKPTPRSSIAPLAPPAQNTTARVEAKYMPNVYIPAAPTIPNIIVGFIRTKAGKLIDGAILEIRNSFGTPVRALKTNKIGQFQIATPLSNGIYEIEIDKEGLVFDIIKITLDGKIVPPIEIISKN